ncbi:MAG: hypothetical protein WAT09_12505 [Paracoccaceae bacterium]
MSKTPKCFISLEKLIYRTRSDIDRPLPSSMIERTDHVDHPFLNDQRHGPAADMVPPPCIVDVEATGLGGVLYQVENLVSIKDDGPKAELKGSDVR